MPNIIPIMAEPKGETISHPAVTPTRPAKAALNVIDTSGFLYLNHVKIIVVQQAVAAHIFVVINIFPAEKIVSSPSMLTVEQPLKPNQQNQSINTPRAAMLKSCPSIALGFPFSSYFPIRGPSIFAPIKAHTPPTICTAVEPAKS